jgi:hypothetical protein
MATHSALTAVDPTVRSPASASPPQFELRRLGVIMEPEAGNPYEVEGVQNPDSVRVPYGATVATSRAEPANVCYYWKRTTCPATSRAAVGSQRNDQYTDD